MEWFHACTNPSSATSRYIDVPPLNPFPIHLFELDPGVRCLSVSGSMPRLPDALHVPIGQKAGRAELNLTFADVNQLELTGVPDREGGELLIFQRDKLETHFEYFSAQFRFSGVCQRASIISIFTRTTFDPNHSPPRGPYLFSHANVWNTCLILLQQFGYTLRAAAQPTESQFPLPLRWHASAPDGTNLTADTPIELLGLATLHRHHQPKADRPYWWRIEGPWLMKDLMDQSRQPLS